MTWPAATSRWVAASLAGCVLIGMLLALAVAGDLASAQTPTYTTSSTVSILAADNNSPLFTADHLDPGSTSTACVDVSVRGASAYDSVVFTGLAVSGALSPYLSVDVQAGEPTAQDCAAFAGMPVFDGTLPALAEPNGDGFSTGWTPARTSTWRFRLSVSVAPSAPRGISASASFQWRLHTGTVAAVASSPVTASPAPSALAGPVAPTRPAGAGRAGAPTAAQHVTLGRANQPFVEHMLTVTGAIASGLLRHSGYPIGFLLLAVFFVLIQDLIDRRDPKLALAPLRNDDLRFTSSPTAVTL